MCFYPTEAILQTSNIYHGAEKGGSIQNAAKHTFIIISHEPIGFNAKISNEVDEWG